MTHCRNMLILHLFSLFYSISDCDSVNAAEDEFEKQIFYYTSVAHKRMVVLRYAVAYEFASVSFGQMIVDRICIWKKDRNIRNCSVASSASDYLYGLSPVCNRIWLFREFGLLNFFPQTWHM